MRSRSQDQLLFDWTPTSTRRPWPASNSFALVSFIAQHFVHHRIQEWLGCQYKETFLFLLLFFFFTIGATKSHTPNHERLFQSRQRDGRDTDLLAWNSLRREPDESMMSGTRGATAALKMAIFRPLFSTLPLRCGGKRLICLSFVLKLVSRQKWFWAGSSPLKALSNLNQAKFKHRRAELAPEWVTTRENSVLEATLGAPDTRRSQHHTSAWVCQSCQQNSLLQSVPGVWNYVKKQYLHTNTKIWEIGNEIVHEVAQGDKHHLRKFSDHMNKSVRWAEQTLLYWLVLCDLQIFSGGVYHLFLRFPTVFGLVWLVRTLQLNTWSIIFGSSIRRRIVSGLERRKEECEIFGYRKCELIANWRWRRTACRMRHVSFLFLLVLLLLFRTWYNIATSHTTLKRISQIPLYNLPCQTCFFVVVGFVFGLSLCGSLPPPSSLLRFSRIHLMFCWVKMFYLKLPWLVTRETKSPLANSFSLFSEMPVLCSKVSIPTCSVVLRTSIEQDIAHLDILVCTKVTQAICYRKVLLAAQLDV